MERADFEALIERMERIAVARPRAYRRHVFGLAALGYGYLAFVVLVLLGLTALTIWSHSSIRSAPAPHNPRRGQFVRDAR
jgi:hypothetical protein